MKTSILSSLFLISGFFAGAQIVNFPDLVARSKPCIFKITTYDASDAELAIGTGFFIDSSGTGITNYHVLQGAKKAKIQTSDNKKYIINKVDSWTKESDMVKFEVNNELHEKFPYLKIGITTPKEGEDIFIIGSPLGFEQTVTKGIVSSVRDDKDYGEVYQFDAAMSHGSSGSPLMNMKGEAIGVVTYFYNGGQMLNFAVSLKNLTVMEPIGAYRFPPDDGEDLSINHGDDDGDYSEDYNNPSSTFYFIDSKIEFCTDLNSEEQCSNAGSVFNIDKVNGSFVYVFVGNNGKKLGVKSISVEVYRKKGEEYDEFIEEKAYDISEESPDTHFKYTFTDKGDYKFEVYTKENVWINDGYVTIKFKN